MTKLTICLVQFLTSIQQTGLLESATSLYNANHMPMIFFRHIDNCTKLLWNIKSMCKFWEISLNLKKLITLLNNVESLPVNSHFGSVDRINVICVKRHLSTCIQQQHNSIVLLTIAGKTFWNLLPVEDEEQFHIWTYTSTVVVGPSCSVTSPVFAACFTIGFLRSLCIRDDLWLWNLTNKAST